MAKSASSSLERRSRRNGTLFMLPWICGVIMFFLIPLIQSVVFSFCDVTITTDGFGLDFIGLENFRYIIYESPEYINNLLSTLTELGYQIPIIFILSLIVAVVLNTQFPGRTFFRSLYFIPVILVNSVVMEFFGGKASIEELSAATQSAYLDGLINFEAIFAQMGISSSVTELIFRYVDQIFDLVWQCGVQIILFVSGLQSIPDQLYEVSKVEGASKWEEFWYITIPMLGHTMVLVMVYTAVEFCISTNNKVVQQAYTVLLNQQIYSKSSAMLWFFFVVVAAIILAVFVVFHKFCLKKWQ